MAGTSSIPVIVGPTASGKTELALNLAKILNGEIISADSRQIYRELNIGTAKPSQDELVAIPHHFIDELNPDEEYHVSLYEEQAKERINSIFQKGKTPIVCGGSGLYVRALIEGIDVPVQVNPQLRAEMKKIIDNEGYQALYQKLLALDPALAGELLPQNWKRVMRAIEVFEATGRSIADFWNDKKAQIPGRFRVFMLNRERELLYERINARTEQMFSSGLIEETQSALDKYGDSRLNALNTVGYKECVMYLSNQISREEAIRRTKVHTRHYAKRQLTWFRAYSYITSVNVSKETDLHILAQLLAKEFV